MQNPSKNSRTSSKSDSPCHPDQTPPPPDPSQTVAGDVTTTEEGGSSVGGVVASSDAGTAQVVDPTPAGAEGGSSAALVSVEGGVVVAPTPPPEKQCKQKRKSAQLSDPPPWPPKCNECGKEFPSWKAAFGHMRAHPDREYRGFFKPPTSSASSSPRQRVRLVAGENINTGGGEKGASSAATGGVGFDLNQPTTEEVESSNSEAATHRNEALDSSSSAVEKKVGFDLNQPPPSEDDNDQHQP